ncbi:MAG: hypothetical protein HY362_02895 [Candidatus Aenigmarchaeota archaeon]|nr:hypothetical protein [Candidatus Aenigmarchaeota archaeon]
MTLKTIKNVRENKWAEFKSLAAKDRINMGTLLENMISHYSKHREEVWNKILHGEKHLSDKEAEDLKKFIESIRKEKWF